MQLARKDSESALLARVAFLLAGLIASEPVRAAQQVCLEQGESVAGLAYVEAQRLADLDLDGDLDVVAMAETSGPSWGWGIVISLGNGDGTFAPPELHSYPIWTGEFDLGDLDGDGWLDIALAYRIQHTSGTYFEMLRNDATGHFVPGSSFTSPAYSTGLDCSDMNGDGDVDLVLGAYSSVRVFSNAGGMVFTVGPQTDFAVDALHFPRTGDLDGDGDADVALSRYLGFSTPGEILLAMNAGDGTLLAPISIPVGPAPLGAMLVDLDADGDLDVGVAQYADPSVHVIQNLGAGAFAVTGQVVTGLATSARATDFDRDGDPDLLLGMRTPFSIQVLANSGQGTFSLAHTEQLMSHPSAIEAGDLDGDGDVEILTGLTAGFPSTAGTWRNCERSGVPFCAGDGSGTTCPCGNESAAGADAGCRNSTGAGATLEGAGSARLADDQLVLTFAGGPAATTALLFQGDLRENGGAGVVLGDGLRCVGGNLMRLGTVAASGGNAQFPGPGQPSISTRGLVTTPGERVYQVWYRNAADFCTSATFNLSNGLAVRWNP